MKANHSVCKTCTLAAACDATIEMAKAMPDIEAFKPAIGAAVLRRQCLETVAGKVACPHVDAEETRSDCGLAGATDMVFKGLTSHKWDAEKFVQYADTVLTADTEAAPAALPVPRYAMQSSSMNSGPTGQYL